ncbi:MAG: hypothetical protein ABR582_15385 [Gemmatimonadaceae bacterium]
MKTRSIITCVALSFGRLVDAQSIDLDQARLYFSEVRHLGELDAGGLWGRRVDGPMFFVDPQTRQIVANMRDSAGILRAQNGVWVGTLPLDRSPANTAITWAGRHWSMVMWPLSDSRYARDRLLMHESYHRIQDDLHLPARDRANNQFGTAEGRIWTRLEWRALVEALLRSGEERKRALSDAMTFRARREQLSPNAADDERALELNEGLAEYTGYALSGLPHSALYDRIAVNLAQSEQQENFARAFPYVSGPAYALLLDATGQTWRKKLNERSNIAELAAKAYGVTNVDVTTAETRSARYSPARMIAEERARETRRVETEKRLRAKFVDGPAVTIIPGSKFNYSYDPNGATPLQNVGTVFESSRITDEWGTLDVTSGGVLMRRDSGPITAVVVSAPGGETPPMKGDGWEIHLAPGWSIERGTRPGDWVLQQHR